METVSVVIATYNSGDYLRLAIDSVLAQTYSDYHLYVVDDGSTDSTPSFLAKFDSHPLVTCFRQPNRGQASAKNHGANISNGKLIAFLDADDYWDNDKLAAQVPLFGNDDVGVVFSNARNIDELGNPHRIQPVTVHHPTGRVTKQLVNRNFVPFGTSVIRRICFEEAEGFDESLPMGIDWDLWLRVSLAWEFDYVPKALLNYRIWAGQMSKNVVGRYDNAFAILDRFTEKNRSILSPKTINMGYADCFARRAYYHAKQNHNLRSAWSDIISAIRRCPSHRYCWRILIRIIYHSLRRSRAEV